MRINRLSKSQVLLFFLLALSFLLLGFKASAAEESDPRYSSIILGLGESTKLEMQTSMKIHVSDGSVVRGRKVGNQIVLTGKKIGRAHLRFLNGQNSKPDLMIYVTDRKTAATARKFHEFIRSRRGLALDFSALPNLVVNGELLRLDDWRNLIDIARINQIPWQLQADILPREQLRQALISELKLLNWSSDYLKVERSGLVLITNKERDKFRAADLMQVSTLGLRLEHSAAITDLEPMIRTQVVIAELRRATVQRIGIKWPTSFQIGGQAALLDISSLKAELEAAEQSGEGRILAMPNLLCKSGGEAKFFAGGEIPIRTSNYKNSNVEWKKYGITLNVFPRADRLKRLKFQLTTEISSLDESMRSQDGIPGVTANRIETQFNLVGSQTVALSGLVKREQGKHLSGLGVLNSIPILGKLFESQDFRDNVTELIIFLTPEISFPENTEET